MTENILHIELGPWTLCVTNAREAMPVLAPSGPLGAFVRDRISVDSEPVRIGVDFEPLSGTIPSLDAFPVVYRHRGGWELRRECDEIVWAVLPIPAGTNRWQRVVRISPESVRLHVPPDSHMREEPLGLLFTEILWLALLSRCEALLLHASAARIGDEALLFPGASGAGKSTLARLWQKSGNGEILADESLMIWSDKCGLRVGGTPWPGSAGVYSASVATPAATMHLAHGSENRLIPLSPADGATSVLAQAFLPHWDAAALAGSAAIADRLTQAAPGYTYAFRPEASAVRHLVHWMNDRPG